LDLLKQTTRLGFGIVKIWEPANCK
jgi:hypothetical protein